MSLIIYLLSCDQNMEFINGAISGMTGLLLSHPFDTIKTNIQNGTTIRYNLKFLYKGVAPPLLGVGFEKSIVFGTYEMCKHNFGLNAGAIPLYGALSGFMASFIVTPTERLKILWQTNNSSNLKTNLNIKYLFRGLSATFTREMPGFAIYFSNYEFLKYNFYTKKDKCITPVVSFIFGGISGAMAWTFIYPQDVIKTRMQASVKCNKGIIEIIGEIKKEGGYRMFYKGFHYALMRAVPLHAGTFAMMEVLSKKN